MSHNRVKARQPHNPCSTRSQEEFRSFAGEGGRFTSGMSGMKGRSCPPQRTGDGLDK
jgi:hypothetical protein